MRNINLPQIQRFRSQLHMKINAQPSLLERKVRFRSVEMLRLHQRRHGSHHRRPSHVEVRSGGTEELELVNAHEPTIRIHIVETHGHLDVWICH